MSIDFRYYQLDMMERIIKLVNKGYKRFSVFMPLGTGRIVTESGVIKELYSHNIGRKVLYICTSSKIEYQVKASFQHYFTETHLDIEVMTQAKLHKRIDKMFLEMYDIILLEDVSAGCRKKLYDKIKNSEQIVISISNGPYKVETKRETDGKVSLSITKNKTRSSGINFEPGIYLFPTTSLLDIRDILDVSIDELEEIKKTILKGMDFFVSLDQLVQDGFLKSVDYDKEKIKKRIQELEKREKELLRLIEEKENE